MSERQSWWDGFLDDADPLRPYTSVFYQLSYLIGRVGGVTGSFVPYEAVYAALWFARGVLTYEIVRRLVPRAGLLPFLAGSLVLVHASDGALNWVGQMNQFGMIFWLLLSVYFLVLAVTVESGKWASLWCVLSLVGVRLCLWSYESGLGLVLLAPAIVLLARHRSLTPLRVVYALLYYVPALYYVLLNIARYANGNGSTYQESVLRSDIGVRPILNDLAFNVDASLRFWAWNDQPPAIGVWPVVVGLIGAGIVIVGGVAVQSRADWRYRDDVVPGRQSLAAVAVVGMVLLVARLPRVSASRLGAQPVADAVSLGHRLRHCNRRRRVFGRDLGRRTPTPCRGSLGAHRCRRVFRRHGLLRRGELPLPHLDRHRDAVADVLEIAPRLEPGSVMVYTGIPHSADPFGDTMWFDMALKLAYPGVPLSGEYFYDDGGAAPGATLAYLRAAGSRRKGPCHLCLGCNARQHPVHLVRTESSASAREASGPFPSRTGPPAPTGPARLIEKPPPDERAIRRYGPIHTMQHRSDRGEP